MTQAPTLDTLQWEMFKQHLRRRWNLDLDAYRQERIQSRVQGWMRRQGIATLQELIRKLDADPDLYHRLQDALFINTSSFYRDEGVFTPLKERILPELIQRFGRLNIWSAACSFGAEPYTVSILLHELGEGGRHHILGTDIDVKALEQARQGLFHPQYLENLPEPLRQRYFTRQGDQMAIDPRVKVGVTFQRHNLLSDPVPGQFHLILCRNVLIYFTPETQKRIIERLSQALPAGGYLIIGSTEGIFNPQELGLVRDIHAVYRKEQAPARTAVVGSQWR